MERGHPLKILARNRGRWHFVTLLLNRRREEREGVFVGFVLIVAERPQLNTLRCHGYEFHGAGLGSEHTKP